MRIFPGAAVLGTTRESRTIGDMMTGHLIGSSGILRNHYLCEQAVQAAVSCEKKSFELQNQIRTQISPELAGFVTTVANLQTRAVRKLQASDAPPRVWWGTEKSFQQATPWQVAKLKSQWFADEPVFDLCCGSGGDALQLMKRGPVIAVDADPLIAELVAANLGVDRVMKSDAIDWTEDEVGMNPESQTPLLPQVFCNDVTRLQLPPKSWINIDPDRRPDSKKTITGSSRTSTPEHYQPAWSSVVQLIGDSSGACVKLAPAATPNMERLSAAHRCWISLTGSVREQTLLCGGVLSNSELPVSGRSAAAVKSDGTTDWFIANPEQVTQRAPITNRPMNWIVDPDAAIRAAGLTEAYAVTNRLSVLGRASGFLTGANPPASDQMGISAEVLWSGSCDDRKIRRELRQRDFYPAVIKVRGTDHSPEKLTRKYRQCGQQPICLWIGRGKERVFAAFTK